MITYLITIINNIFCFIDNNYFQLHIENDFGANEFLNLRWNLENKWKREPKIGLEGLLYLSHLKKYATFYDGWILI